MDPRVQSMDELRETIHEVWRHMPQQYVRRLIHNMRRRVAAVIAADGGSTHYWLLSLLNLSLFICHYVISSGYTVFLSLYMFTQINKLIAEDSYCSYRISVHFLLDCLRYSASCTHNGNVWTLRLGTLENNHSTPGLSISFQLCRKLTKHLLYHIANFDGGTQCVIWGVICIFMKSISCSSGCAPSPWTRSVLHITGVFVCVFSVYYTPFSATFALFGQCAIL